MTFPEGGSTHPPRVMSGQRGLCQTPVAPGFGATRSHQDGVAMANENELELQLAQAQAEIDRLRSENEALSRAEPRTAGHHWIRSTAVVVLFAVGFALVPIAGLAVWSRNTLLDTDRYVETVAPLSDDPNVINSVAGRITDAIFAQIDVEGELAANLPPRLTFAAGPIANQIESTTNGLVVKALETDQFDTLWAEVNRQASEAIVAYVNGDTSGALVISDDGQLLLELGPILDAVKTRLLDQGVAIAEKIPSTTASIPLPVGDVSYLQDLKSALQLLKTLALVLPWLAALFFLGAVMLSRDRRRGIVWTGLLVAGGALLVGISLALGRQAYLDAAVAGGADLGTAQAVFDTVVRFLRNGIRVIFFFGVLLAFGAAVSGPSAWATKTRELSGSLFTQGGAKTGWDTGAFGTFVAASPQGTSTRGGGCLRRSWCSWSTGRHRARCCGSGSRCWSSSPLSSSSLRPRPARTLTSANGSSPRPDGSHPMSLRRKSRLTPCAWVSVTPCTSSPCAPSSTSSWLWCFLRSSASRNLALTSSGAPAVSSLMA